MWARVLVTIERWAGARRSGINLDRYGRHPRAERTRGALVRLGSPRAVHLQRGGSASAATESTGHGAHVHAGGNEFGRCVVPELVKVHVPPEPGTHARVPLADRVGVDPLAGVRH